MDNKEAVVYPEWEGDPGNGYWYVCSECHGYLTGKEEVCPWCKGRIDWNGEDLH